MKKVMSVSFIVVLMALAGFAQAQLSVGAKGSLNMFNLSHKNSEGEKIKNSVIPALDAGIFLEIPVSRDELYFHPELLYVTKGSKAKEPEEATKRLSYFELPLLIMYKGDLGFGRLILGLGPYLAKGVKGKLKTPEGTTQVTFSNNVSSAEAEDGAARPLDMGGKVSIGYEFGNGMFATFNVSGGFTNIEPKINGQKPTSKTRNTGFGFSVGYRIGQ